MMRGSTGTYEKTTIAGETVRAFVPAPLPPMPPLAIDAARQRLMDDALLACGRLDGVAAFLPDPELFVYSYVRREAVLSSQIEGTQSSLSDLLRYELEGATGAPFDDVAEVSNYVAALLHGIERLNSDFPLSNRLVRELHAKLMAGGRGGDKSPGELRTSQNWIGGSRPGKAHFVPPPPHRVAECMGALEKYLHAPNVPALMKVALAHVQFETIHPFLDGNGRTGRLLMSLILHQEGVLRKPMLYLSYYLKANRAEYYRLLDGVRADGDWEAWLDFIFVGIRETAEGAVRTTYRLLEMFKKDEDRIQKQGKVAVGTFRAFGEFRKRPLLNINQLVEGAGIAVPTANRAVRELEALGIVKEITGNKRGRVFTYAEYLGILSEGAEG